MEASRAASHVEFFAKALYSDFRKLWKTGGTGCEPRNVLQSRSLTAYYVGHVLKCNFFFANRIGNLHFLLLQRFGRFRGRATKDLQPSKQNLPVSWRGYPSL
jgi:hypothetical protein